MNKTKSNEIRAKSVRYFRDVLGYPEENIETNKAMGISSGLILCFRVFVYGKAKIIVGYLNLNNQQIEEEETRLLGHKMHASLLAQKLNVPYYVLSDSIDYHWFDSKTDEPLDSALSFEDLKKETPQIHEELFQFLESKRKEDKKLRLFLKSRKKQDKEFTYKLRPNNNNGRLAKGYWFFGNDNYIALSFWNGTDWKNKTPNIYLVFLPSGEVNLVFSGRDSSVKAEFLQKLATIIPGFQEIKSRETNKQFWQKQIASAGETSFVKVLEKFINTDKKIIDTFISNELDLKKNDLDGIKFITTEELEKNISSISNYRKNLPESAYLSLKVTSVVQNNHTSKIKLRSLTLKNIGLFHSLEIDLSARIICLLGENGTGKSTILRAILLGLAGIEETSEIDIERKEIQQLLRINGEEEGIPLYTTKGHIILTYEYDDSSVNKINFEKRKDEIDVRIVEASEGITKATHSGNFFQHLVLGFPQVQGKKEKNRNGLMKKAHIQDVLPLLYDEVDSRFEELSEWIIKLHAETANTSEKKTAQKIIDFIFEVITDIIEENIQFHKVNHIDEILWIKLNGDTIIPFRLISQGFKNIFAWIGHFIKRLAESNDYTSNFMDAPAILVIDEISTYLHPKWQKNILNVLAQKFPNTQIIVTTHSPLVANYLQEKDKALYIIKENEVLPVSHIYGKEISDIFYQWMQVKLRPDEIQKEIDQLFNEIDKENIEQAKIIYNKLLPDLGKNDPSLVEARTYMQLVEN